MRRPAPVPLYSGCGRKWGSHLGTRLPGENAHFRSKHKSPLQGQWAQSCYVQMDSSPVRPPQSGSQALVPSVRKGQTCVLLASSRHLCSTPHLLTSCWILKPEAPAWRHCGSHIHTPEPGTLQSSEDPGTVSAGRQDVPSSISREGAALRESRSVSAHECRKHLITPLGFGNRNSAAQRW